MGLLFCRTKKLVVMEFKGSIECVCVQFDHEADLVKYIKASGQMRERSDASAKGKDQDDLCSIR